MKVLSPLTATLYSLVLLALGFIIGLGYQSYQYVKQHQKTSTKTDISPPAIRGIRVSPDDQLVAFNAIYNNNAKSSRFVFNLQTYKWSAAETPAGWQDSMVQWGKDGKTLLYERSKIPQIHTSAIAGLYSEKIDTVQNVPQWRGQKVLSADLSYPGEQIYAGFWTANNQLIVKTQHSDRSLFAVEQNTMVPIDRSPATYYQNRAVTTPSGTDFYAVRDVDRSGSKSALFRIRGNHSVQIGPAFQNIIWAYLSENAQWLLLCTRAPDGENWMWTLWKVQNETLQKIKTAQVPSDVIAVYWSPDFKHILGAVGNSLWRIDVPTLVIHKIGDRDDWHADDAAWLNNQNAVLVAAAGKLWKVNVQNGKCTEIWDLPQKYWN